MALLAAALTTLARTKLYLDITSTSKNSLIEMLINSASNYVERYCRRTFKRTTYTQELYDGKGINRLPIKNYPIISGQTFTLEERNSVNNESDWETVDSENYFIDYDTGIVKALFEFKEGFQNYRVTYTAGYYLPSASEYQDGTNDNQDLPADIETAVMDLVAIGLNTRKAAGIKQERARDLSLVYEKEAAQNPLLKESLNRFKRYRF